MPSVLKLSLLKKPGGVVQGRITSVSIKPNEAMNAFEYAKIYREQLEALMPMVRLDLIIDSRGGLAESACGLLDVLEDLDRPIRVLIDGQCSSAATLIAFGAVVGDVSITPNSYVYVHMPTVGRYKQEGGIWTAMKRLGTLTCAHLFMGTYAARSKQSKRIWKQYMVEGTTFKAPDAVAVGLCDRVLERWRWEACP